MATWTQGCQSDRIPSVRGDEQLAPEMKGTRRDSGEQFISDEAFLAKLDRNVAAYGPQQLNSFWRALATSFAVPGLFGYRPSRGEQALLMTIDNGRANAIAMRDGVAAAIKARRSA